MVKTRSKHVDYVVTESDVGRSFREKQKRRRVVDSLSNDSVSAVNIDHTSNKKCRSIEESSRLHNNNSVEFTVSLPLSSNANMEESECQLLSVIDTTNDTTNTKRILFDLAEDIIDSNSNEVIVKNTDSNMIDNSSQITDLNVSIGVSVNVTNDFNNDDKISDRNTYIDEFVATSDIPTENITTYTLSVSPPTCLHFGANRHGKYPEHFFCSECTRFEEQSTLKKTPSKNRSMYKYRCQANHGSKHYPTVLKSDRVHYLNKKMNDCNTIASRNNSIESNVCIDNIDSYVENNSVSYCLMYKALLLNNDKLHESYQKLVDKNLAQTTEIDRLVSQHLVNNSLVENKNMLLAMQCESNKLLEKQITELEAQIILYKSMNTLAENKVSKFKTNNSIIQKSKKKLKQQLSSTNKTTELFFDDLSNSIQKHGSMKRRNSDLLCKRLIEHLWKLDLFDGAIQSYMIDIVKNHLRENVFSPERILEQLDMHGGQLSLQGIDILRQLECDGKKYNRNTVIPHSSSISKMQRKVDAFASTIMPFVVGKLKNNAEFIEFNPEHVIPLMYKAYKVENLAKQRSIKVDQSIDSAQISKRQQVTVWGLKMIDYAARHPKKGHLLIGSQDESSIQSRTNCFPIKIALDRENNETYNQFSDNMKKVHELSKCNLGPYKPIECAMACDLAATWKIVKMGGALKNRKFGCHLCAEEDKSIGVPHPVKCEKFCKKLHEHDLNHECHHEEILTNDNILLKLNKINNIKEILGDLLPKLEKLAAESKINLDEDPRGITNAASKSNIKSIHFDLTSNLITDETKQHYLNCITADLQLRNMSPLGTALKKQKRLQEIMILEWSYRKLDVALKLVEKNGNTRILNILECVPCILHMENRCGIKILTMLLRDGLKCAAERKTFQHIKCKEKRILEFVKQVELIANTEVLGTEDRPACWHLPFDHSKLVLESITLDNNRTRALIDNLSSLVDLCIYDNNKHAKVTECVNYYRSLFSMLRKREDFSDEDILQFQKFSDYFYREWINLYGREGVTNYIHMIGSGHVAEFLTEYRNLYIHSQQGWENLNSFLKVFFFRRTMRGGGRGNGSKIVPIAKWLARRMVWMSGTYKETTSETNKENIEANDSIENVHEDIDNDDWLEYDFNVLSSSLCVQTSNNDTSKSEEGNDTLENLNKNHEKDDSLEYNFNVLSSSFCLPTSRDDTPKNENKEFKL